MANVRVGGAGLQPSRGTGPQSLDDKIKMAAQLTIQRDKSKHLPTRNQISGRIHSTLKDATDLLHGKATDALKGGTREEIQTLAKQAKQIKNLFPTDSSEKKRAAGIAAILDEKAAASTSPKAGPRQSARPAAQTRNTGDIRSPEQEQFDTEMFDLWVESKHEDNVKVRSGQEAPPPNKTFSEKLKGQIRNEQDATRKGWLQQHLAHLLKKT